MSERAMNDAADIDGADVLGALLEPIMAALQKDGVTELVVNEPGRFLIETEEGWVAQPCEALTEMHLQAAATAVATFSNQEVSRARPVLSAMLPAGERIQIVVPPAVPEGRISLSVRKPSTRVASIDSFETAGLFETVRWQADTAVSAGAPEAVLGADERALTECIGARRFAEFFAHAVRSRLNICVVGDTGSGKTTFMKSLCRHIPPHERVITIEDVRELFLEHPNVVHLLYSKGGQGVARVSPADLIASCMRMKPDRVLLAELRGSESYDFLKLLTTGHSGSITSFHAASCGEAIARFVLMAKEHPEAAAYQDVALKRLFFSTIDVVAHMKVEPKLDDDGRQVGKRRVMTEIYYSPRKKAALAYET